MIIFFVSLHRITEMNTWGRPVLTVSGIK